jgi:hypothetical protein
VKRQHFSTAATLRVLLHVQHSIVHICVHPVCLHTSFQALKWTGASTPHKFARPTYCYWLQGNRSTTSEWTLMTLCWNKVWWKSIGWYKRLKKRHTQTAYWSHKPIFFPEESGLKTGSKHDRRLSDWAPTYLQSQRREDTRSRTCEAPTRHWVTRGIGVRFPAGGRDSSVLHNVQTGCGALKPRVQRVPGTLTQGLKFTGSETHHSPPAQVRDGGALLPFPIHLHGMELH